MGVPGWMLAASTAVDYIDAFQGYAWPLVALLALGFFLIHFRAGIKSFLSRAESMSAFGVEVVAPKDQSPVVEEDEAEEDEGELDSSTAMWVNSIINYNSPRRTPR